MRLTMTSVALGAISVSGVAFAEAHTEQCFDKGTLTYVDCPTEEVVVVEPEPLPYVGAWTGMYIGAHAGYAWANVSGLYDNLDPSAPPDVLNFSSLEADGWLAGGQIGYLHQFESNLVLGVEVDASYVDIADSQTIQDNTAVNSQTATFEVNWLATARARAGYAFGSVLPYATGGIALANIDASVRDTPPGATFELGELAVGGVAGAGLEVMVLENVSLRGEGLYYFFNEKSSLDTPFSGLADGDPGDFFEFEDMWSIRGAVNVHF